MNAVCQDRTSSRRHLTVLAVVVLVLFSVSCSAGPARRSGTRQESHILAAEVDRLVAAEKPAPASALLDGSIARKIRDRGYLIVGGNQTAELFSSFDPGTNEYEGMDAALSRLLAKYIIGVPQTRLVEVTAGNREVLLQDHSVDAVFATYTMTPARARIVDFAGPYYMDGLAVEVRKGNSEIRAMKDLAHKSVVTQTGSTAPAIIHDLVPTAKIQSFYTNNFCVGVLESGKTDAYVLDQSILAGNTVSDKGVKVLPGVYTKEPYGIGLPKGENEFRNFVNNWLRHIESDGTWAKVWQTTVGSAVPGPTPTPPPIASANDH